VEEMAQRAIEETGSGVIGGAAVMFSLFIIWKLVEEVLRYRGMKSSRKVNGTPCKWTTDDHDNIRSMKEAIERIENNLK